MTKTLLKFRKDGQEALLEVEQTTSQQVDKLIDGMLSFFSIPVPERIQQERIQPSAGIEEKPTTVKHVINNTVIKGEPITMAEALKEAAATKENHVPDYFKTGIKVKNGINHYRCRYRCPKCGHAGNHYIPEGTEIVDCHQCQTSMVVKKATPGTQGIQPDKFMNWYVAGDQLPVAEFVYGKANALK
jgi:ribosomal protein L37AE/L43A